MELRCISGWSLLCVCFVLLICIQESTQNIPPEMWARLKNVTDVREFIKHFLKKKPHNGEIPSFPPTTGHHERPDGMPGPSPDGHIPGEDMLWTQEGSLIEEGTAAVSNMLDDLADRCEAKMTSVEVNNGNDPNILFWPSCIRIQQCSGCCNNEILQCAPRVVQSVGTQVMRARYPYPGADVFEFEGMYTMYFDRHLECACECREKADHCTPGIHEYDPYSCKCRCHNEWESGNCGSPKVWNNSLCGCVCPLIGRQCYDDEEYSHITCSCVPSTRAGMSITEIESGPVQTDRCSREKRCQYGYVPVEDNGECRCIVASSLIMEGSLSDNSGRPTRIPTRRTEAARTTPRPTRPPRPTRRPRRRRPPTRSRSQVDQRN